MCLGFNLLVSLTNNTLLYAVDNILNHFRPEIFFFNPTISRSSLKMTNFMGVKYYFSSKFGSWPEKFFAIFRIYKYKFIGFKTKILCPICDSFNLFLTTSGFELSMTQKIQKTRIFPWVERFSTLINNFIAIDNNCL
jgi:hypothetical protein